MSFRLYNFFLVLPVVYLLYVGAELGYRSVERKSIFEASPVFEKKSDTVSGLDLSAKEGSKLHLQDFHRVEVRNGKPFWEVKAKDAKYYANEAVTHVNDASVVIYRAHGSSIQLTSKAARLYLDGKSINKMSLEGNILVEIDDSLSVRTELAEYDGETERVVAPGRVEISGKGFEVHGEGLRLDVKEYDMTLAKNVTSEFHEGAQAPKGIVKGLEQND